VGVFERVAPSLLIRRSMPCVRPVRQSSQPQVRVRRAEVAGLLCGAHAQVLSTAELSIGRRIARAVRTDVQRVPGSFSCRFGARGRVSVTAVSVRGP